MESEPLYGGIEAGGTKMVCAVSDRSGRIITEAQYPTTSPEETLERLAGFFTSFPERDRLVALGIGSFGPVDLNLDSPTFGYITTTPKPGWANTNVSGFLGDRLGLPVGFDTDVNAAALAEHRWGAAQGLSTFIYLTVGTGVGGGGLVDGRPMHGLVHPEMGHVPVPHRADDPFKGFCPYHGDCLEGMASGPALEARWGVRGHTLGPDHPAWELEAHYLAYALASYIYVQSPQRLILGGGVMHQRHLFPLIRKEVQRILNGYVQAREIIEDIDAFIVPPGLEDRAGVLGAIALALDAR